MYTVIYRVPVEKSYEFSFRKANIMLAGGYWFTRQDESKCDRVYPISLNGPDDELVHMGEDYTVHEVATTLCRTSGVEFIGIVGE